MRRLWQNWTVHNLISHPLSELAYWVVRLIGGVAVARKVAGAIHDFSIPQHEAGQGRG